MDGTAKPGIQKTLDCDQVNNQVLDDLRKLNRITNDRIQFPLKGKVGFELRPAERKKDGKGENFRNIQRPFAAVLLDATIPGVDCDSIGPNRSRNNGTNDIAVWSEAAKPESENSDLHI